MPPVHAFCRQSLSGQCPPIKATGAGCGKPRPRAGREKDACFDRNSARTLGTGIAELIPLNEELVTEMDMLVGPLLERDGGYVYDTFTVADGLRSSFRYLRLDAARYDQRALIAEAQRDPRCNVRVCETRTEFEQLVEAARRGDAPVAETEPQN